MLKKITFKIDSLGHIDSMNFKLPPFKNITFQIILGSYNCPFFRFLKY